jgi:phasin family protein
MNIHKEQIVDNSRANVDAAIQIANIISESTERLFKLQTEAASAALAENSEALKGLLNVTDSGALLAEWPSLYQAKVQRAMGVTRSWMEIVSQTQADITQLMGKRFSMGPQLNLEQFTNDNFFAAIRKPIIKDSRGPDRDAGIPRNASGKVNGRKAARNLKVI